MYTKQYLERYCKLYIVGWIFNQKYVHFQSQPCAAKYIHSTYQWKLKPSFTNLGNARVIKLL